MDDSERRRLLDRIRRPANTVGESIPDELEVGGTTVDLKAFVFECSRLGSIPEAERERIESVKRDLRRERLDRKRRIERGEVDYGRGERLVETIHGIDRALAALEGLDEPDVGEQLRRKELEDAAELVSLIERRPG
jgi:hypothetical protein